MSIEAPIGGWDDGWSIAPDLRRILVDTLQTERPALVLECGSGVSTVLAAGEVTAWGGRVVALEHDPGYAARTRELLAARGLTGRGTVVEAPLTDVAHGGETLHWYDPAALAGIAGAGVVLVDGPPAATGPLARYPALPLLAPRLAPDAVVLLDDAGRPDERAVTARWRNEFPSWQFRDVPTERGLLVARASLRDLSPGIVD